MNHPEDLLDACMRLFKGMHADLLAGRTDRCLSALESIVDAPLADPSNRRRSAPKPIEPGEMITARRAEQQLVALDWPRGLAKDFVARGKIALTDHRANDATTSASFAQVAAELNARTASLSKYEQRK